MEQAIYTKLDASPLPFLHLIGNLKHLPRTGWMRFIERPESVAAHSWRVTALGMCAPDGVDAERCMFLGHCHDMAEAVVGDIPTFAGMPKERKHKLEDFGIRYIESLLKPFNPILGAKIRTAWEEYEEGTTLEAQFVRMCDKLECLVQAHEYELLTNGEQEGLQEFQGLISKINSEEGKAWVALLQEERKAHFSRLKKRAHIIYVIGPSGVGKKTQCTRLSKEFGFQLVSLDELLRQKSDDQTYLHAQYVKDCLAEEVDVATDLAISLLERKISEVNTWSLVLGFPERMEQLVEFEKKVQKTNYTLLLNCSAEHIRQRVEKLGSSGGASDGPDTVKKIQGFQTPSADVENHLKAVEGYIKEINCDGSIEEVYGFVKKAVEEIIQHAKTEK